MKYKVYLYALVAVIVVGVAAYLIGSKIKKNNDADALPSDKEWGKELAEDQSKQINRLSKELYDDMKGLNVLFFRNPKPYEELAAASDKILVGVSNQFRQSYNASLLEWLKGESFHWYSFNLQNTADNLINRLYTLIGK